MGRYLGGGEWHTRRGGSGVAWSGDACVALVLRAPSPSRQGDASVPTPPHPNPRPYGYEGAPKGHDNKPTRESGSGVDADWGRLRRPGGRRNACTGEGRGQRKRPHPYGREVPSEATL
ncbi:MAG: hypothetical protein E6I91_04235 [Chloroflexi bacterium]|nr:MAG: hypothetical protein E6I91_04235 [Chloroflexota bacterium]